MKLAPNLVFLLFLQCLSSQIQKDVDFVHGEVLVEPLAHERAIKGQVRYHFEVLGDVDSLFLDAHEMEFSSVLLDGRAVEHSIGPNKIVIVHGFQKGGSHQLLLQYRTRPKQTVYFLGWEGQDLSLAQIWTQGQGKYTSHWLPSFDDMTEKVEFDLSLDFDQKYQVAANGKLMDRQKIGEKIRWKYDMQNPMSSYLLAFAIGRFEKKTLHAASGVPLELFYHPKDRSRVEPTYRHTKAIFDFLEKEIGFPYPWQGYRQVPVQDFLYAGMENTGCTLFSNQYVVDSTAFVDKNYVNVNAHEMAHQWFGNLVTQTRSEHHWLHEGFATYFAYLAERAIFGEEHFYWHLLDTADALKNFSAEGQGEALRNPTAGSLTFYEKGAWALAVLHERVGDAHFKEGIKDYLQENAFQNVEIPDFLGEIERVSGQDLSDFDEHWLKDPDFHYDTAKAHLMEKSASIRRYFQLREEIGRHVETSGAILEGLWPQFESSKLKQRLIADYGDHFTSGFTAMILACEDLKVRQAAILGMDSIPVELRTGAEALLGDRSYTTLEATLYKLWTSFPDQRAVYLDRTRGIEGFPNKNIRLLWLLLAVATEGYEPGSKARYFGELSSHTSGKYPFETRLIAFQYLRGLGTFTDQSLVDLVKACNHHVWYFKKSARGILNEFLRQGDTEARLKELYPLLNQEERQYLDKKLDE